MTLRFLNDLDDVESRINNCAFIITILKSEPIINELQTIFYVVSKRKQTVFSNNICKYFKQKILPNQSFSYKIDQSHCE